MTDRLFDMEPDVDAEEVLRVLAGVRPPSPAAKAHARRMARIADALKRGVHPATGLPLRPGGGTCGVCAQHVVVPGGRRNYHKCLKRGVTASEAIDIRVGWPACTSFEVRA